MENHRFLLRGHQDLNQNGSSTSSSTSESPVLSLNKVDPRLSSCCCSWSLGSDGGGAVAGSMQTETCSLNTKYQSTPAAQLTVSFSQEQVARSYADKCIKESIQWIH